jgi:hypothetical protein
LLQITAVRAVAADVRSAAAIQADYSQVQRVLAQGSDGRSWNDDDPRLHDLLGRAWALMGEWAAAFLGRTPSPTIEQLTAAIEELNPVDQAPARPALEISDPDEFFRRLESYRLAATAFRLQAGAYAIAISYGYTGRLLVVSPRGVHASSAIGRGGGFFPLPRTATGHDRFAIDANPNDWPTSSCGGGQLTVWEWDGDRVTQLVERSYNYPRGDPKAWGVQRRGRWIKIYTRGELELLGDCCACTGFNAVRKLRIDADRIADLGIEYFVPESAVVDDLLDRAIRGIDAGDIAAPEANACSRRRPPRSRRDSTRPILGPGRLRTDHTGRKRNRVHVLDRRRRVRLPHGGPRRTPLHHRDAAPSPTSGGIPRRGPGQARGARNLSVGPRGPAVGRAAGLAGAAGSRARRGRRRARHPLQRAPSVWPLVYGAPQPRRAV